MYSCVTGLTNATPLPLRKRHEPLGEAFTFGPITLEGPKNVRASLGLLQSVLMRMLTFDAARRSREGTSSSGARTRALLRDFCEEVLLGLGKLFVGDDAFVIERLQLLDGLHDLILGLLFVEALGDLFPLLEE